MGTEIISVMLRVRPLFIGFRLAKLNKGDRFYVWQGNYVYNLRGRCIM